MLMPARLVVARELAEMFRALGHEIRIRIIEELAHGDHLSDFLTIPAYQHLLKDERA